MCGRFEVEPHSDFDPFKFTVEVPRGDVVPFREVMDAIFPYGRILYDEEQDAAEKERRESLLNDKITAFLAPKDPETEEKIAANLKRLFKEIFEGHLFEPKLIAAFHLETPAEIQQARRIFHELCSNIPRVGLRDEVVLIERYGLIDGIGKILKDTGCIIGVGPSQAGSIEHHTLARLHNGYSKPSTPRAYSDLIPAVLELGERPV